jgi:glutaredoxin
MQKTLLLVASLLIGSASVSQTLYKSIGPDGKAVYSDKPPTTGKMEKTLRVQDLPNTAIPTKTLAELEALRKNGRQGAFSASGVVLFSASWCGYCKQAKAFLAQRGVRYQEKDIDTPDGKLAFAQAGSGSGVPLLLVNGATVQGFSPQAYESLFPKRP